VHRTLTTATEWQAVSLAAPLENNEFPLEKIAAEQHDVSPEDAYLQRVAV
jgi:hypothetical protein